MKRLTTDKPTSTVEAMINYAYAKDGKVFLRHGDGEEDIAEIKAFEKKYMEANDAESN